MCKCRYCNKKLDKAHMVYCSRQCQNIYQSIFKNGFKGKHHTKKSKAKIRKAKLGKQWRKLNKKVKDGHSYIFIYSPNHPYKNKNNYVREHRLIMENWLRKNDPNNLLLIKIKGKKYLKFKIIVHHINGIKDDNRIENLMLFETQKEHFNFHWLLSEYIYKQFGFDIFKKYNKWFNKIYNPNTQKSTKKYKSFTNPLFKNRR